MASHYHLHEALHANLLFKKKKSARQRGLNISLASRQKPFALITRNVLRYKRWVKFPLEESEGAVSQLGLGGGLLCSCNWIKLASYVFRPVTLLHPHEANFRSSD